METQLPLLPNLNLQPGESVSFLFGTFVPANGPVVEGTYFQQDFGLELQLTDFPQPDPTKPVSDDNTSWQYSIALANTCDNAQGPGSFQRTAS